jgi:hypothetical protein
MAEYEDREHFIPLRKNELIELLLAEPDLSAQDREDLRQFCTLVVATYHFEYHKALERLKDAYAPFDPDADTRGGRAAPGSTAGRPGGVRLSPGPVPLQLGRGGARGAGVIASAGAIH